MDEKLKFREALNELVAGRPRTAAGFPEKNWKSVCRSLDLRKNNWTWWADI